MHELKQIPKKLLTWFAAHQRNLPWRENRVPYRVWLSEIMLQQTRVEAVKPYFTRFLEKLPDIRALSECPDEELMKLWEGLGYYSRARNLKKAAGEIMERHGGAFPGTYGEIRALSGIGDYTAGAVASICFDLPEPAVDGNVLRVMTRLTCDERCTDDTAVKRDIREKLRILYKEEAGGNCGQLTQALMELGATVCVPNGAPHCTECPLADLCLAHREHSETDFPVRKQKKPRRIEEYTVYILECDGQIAIRKRADTGLLAGLFELPHLDGKREAQAALDAASDWKITANEIISVRQRLHIFTHIEWHMACVHILCSRKDSRFLWVTREQLAAEYALPTAFRICLPPENR